MATALTELLETKEEAEIKDLIYEFRGKQVMLDSDLARLFGVSTTRLNQQMNRNKSRFPNDFCIHLNSLEFKNLRLQNAIFRESTKGRKYAPYMYTEQGIIALVGVLRSNVADQMYIWLS